MGVYIKDMEMPACCNACELAALVDTSDGLAYGCRALKEMIYNNRERLPNCPLVPVPPHRRLIDADELLERFNVEQKQKDMHGRGFASCFENCGELCTEWWCVEEMVETAPTIIPADKDGGA